MEKLCPGFPSDVLRLLCLNSPGFIEFPDDSMLYTLLNIR